MAIVIDDREKEDISRVIMGDDGTGGGIRIPAVLISKTDGDRIVEWIKTASQAQIDELQFQADFVIEHDDNMALVELYYTSSDDTSLDFIRNMARYIEPLID